MTSLHFPTPGDWLLDRKILDSALKAIRSNLVINRNYEIPYSAGYSQDGTVIYIDKHMPEGFYTRKSRFIKTDKFLLLHETVEKALLQFFQQLHDSFPYQFAHQIAYNAEKAAVELEGIEFSEYDNFMMKNVKNIEKIPVGVGAVPADLDLTPYEDEDDDELIRSIIAAQQGG